MPKKAKLRKDEIYLSIYLILKTIYLGFKTDAGLFRSIAICKKIKTNQVEWPRFVLNT